MGRELVCAGELLRLLGQPLRDEDVCVEEAVDAVPEAGLRLAGQLGAGLGALHAHVPALFV